MKTYNSAIVLFAVVSCMTGCNKENTPSDPNVIVPVVKGIQATKATYTEKEEQLLFSVPVKSDAGEEYTLEAWISDTECGMPETKGVPITNDNLATAYGSFKTKAYCNATHSYDIYSSMQNAKASYDSNSGNWSYDKTYKWPAAEYCPLTFCSYAPEDASISNLSLASGPQASFTYTLPTPNGSSDAVNQKDLLFAMDEGSRGTTGQINIKFKHPLTAVKFTRGDISDCTISSISLVNFYDTGTATYNGSGWTWTPSGTKRTFTQSFGTVVNNVPQASDASQSGGSLDPDPNESHTFMVIPQNLTSNSAKIEISLGSSTITYDLSSASDTKVRDWSSYAGKTVTFKVNREIKYEGVDVVVMMDMSRSLSAYSEEWANKVYKARRDQFKAYYTNNFIKPFIGNTSVRIAEGYFTGAFSSSANWSSTSKIKTIIDDGYSVGDNSYMFHHFDKVTSSNYSSSSSTFGKMAQSTSSGKISAAFVGLQEAFWEFYYKGDQTHKYIIVFLSDGWANLATSDDDENYFDANTANLAISANNSFSHGLSNTTISATAKQIKDGYSKDGKTVKADIYSVYLTSPKGSKYSTDSRNLMKAISSDYPNATSLTNMGSSIGGGYYQEIPADGNLTTIFTNIVNAIKATPLK